MELLLANQAAYAPANNMTPAHVAELKHHLSNARSENTRKAYESAWKSFTSFCSQQGFESFPTTPVIVSLYLSHLNDQSYKASTLTQHLSAIKAMHDDNGQGFDWFNHHLIKSTLTSCKRSMVDDGRSTVKKPRAFNQPELRALLESMPLMTAKDYRDRAVIVLGLNSGLRASEYANLRVDDVVFDDRGMDIHIHSSKTDQLGSGETIYIASLAPALRLFDAVNAMREWLRFRETFPTGDQSLFIALRKGGSTAHNGSIGSVHGISRNAVNELLRRAYTASGLHGRNPSSHSLRHTFITQAFSKGVDSTVLAKTTRHRNLRVLSEYNQTERRNNPVSLALW